MVTAILRRDSSLTHGRLVLDITSWDDLPDHESDDWLELVRDLQSLASDFSVTLCLKSRQPGEAGGLEIEPYATALANVRRPPLAAMPILGLSLGQRLALTQSLQLPAIPWSPVEAFFAEGDQPSFLVGEWLALDGLSHTDSLHLIDAANQVFQFNYGKGEEDGRYYKIPLMRDRNIQPDDIKIKISNKEYLAAMEMIDGAGRLQRITRAVRYLEIYQTIMDHLAEKKIDLADIVVIGVDRGGRIPATLVKHALGLNGVRFLKVDQARGDGGGLDEERLERFARDGLFKDKYLVFVDSTVDSGRQIKVLRRYFGGEENYAARGHTGWVVVGSNEDGRTLGKHHLNIHWGVDPDETFEDNPDLLGMDYEPDSMSRVQIHPSTAAHAIRHAFAIVTQGSVLRVPPDIEQRKTQAEQKRKARVVTDSLASRLAETTAEPPGLDLAADLRPHWLRDDVLYQLAQWNPAEDIDADNLTEDDEPENYSLSDLDDAALQGVVDAALARRLGGPVTDPALRIDVVALRARSGHRDRRGRLIDEPHPNPPLHVVCGFPALRATR